MTFVVALPTTSLTTQSCGVTWALPPNNVLPIPSLPFVFTPNFPFPSGSSPKTYGYPIG